MTDYTIRAWKPEDGPALKELWKLGFGDDDEVIDSFFALYLKPDACVVAEADGRVVSAMYIIPDITLNPRRRTTLTAGYTYALATLPEYRGRGIGTAVYRAACCKAMETHDFACVLPAEAALYPLYERANGAAPIAFKREAVFSRDELKAVPTAMAARIPAYQYGGLRENLLIGLPHAIFREDVYDLMERSGTEFFMMENGLAAAETTGGVCTIHELLAPNGGAMTHAATVARWCPAKRYIVRTPVFFEGPGEVKPTALGVCKNRSDISLPDDLWWAFGLE